MKRTVTDDKAVSANMNRLKHLQKRGEALLEYWDRLLPGVSPSTEDFHAWCGNPLWIYTKYREIQLQSMTEMVFDNLPDSAKYPPMDDEPPKYNPLQPTRQGMFTTHGAPKKTKFQERGRYQKVCNLAGQAKTFRDEDPIVVNHTWLKLEKGKLVIPKDSKAKLVKHFTHTYSDEAMAVGGELEGLMEGLAKVFTVTGGKLPISTDRDGRPVIDQKALKKI